ncbi:hypothetical protein LXA43DRAFT_245001 [Ganoderma leucocontextum]|nr:hypothetical protein LXA43DRAFT_245001 [Ganoderma leucocontextum]
MKVAHETFEINVVPLAQNSRHCRLLTCPSLKTSSWCKVKSSLFVPSENPSFGVCYNTPYHHLNFSPRSIMYTDGHQFMPPTPRLRKELPPCPDLVGHPQHGTMPFVGGWSPRSVPPHICVAPLRACERCSCVVIPPVCTKPPKRRPPQGPLRFSCQRQCGSRILPSMPPTRRSRIDEFRCTDVVYPAPLGTWTVSGVQPSLSSPE